MLQDWEKNYFIPNSRDLLFRTPARAWKSGKPELDSSPHNNFDGMHWKKALKEAGLYIQGGDNLHFHALRHFAASFWIESGMPLTDVAMLLGHATFDMTLQTYAHPIVNGAQRLDMIDRASNALIGYHGSAEIIPAATTERQLALSH